MRIAYINVTKIDINDLNNFLSHRSLAIAPSAHSKYCDSRLAVKVNLKLINKIILKKLTAFVTQTLHEIFKKLTTYVCNRFTYRSNRNKQLMRIISFD